MYYSGYYDNDIIMSDESLSDDSDSFNDESSEDNFSDSFNDESSEDNFSDPITNKFEMKSLYDLCENRLKTIVCSQDIDKLRLPKLIENNFYKDQSFLMQGIKKIRNVYKLDSDGIVAFQKVSVDFRNQLWNAYFLMYLWYESSFDKRENVNVYKHVSLGNICKNCCGGGGTWIETNFENRKTTVYNEVCRGKKFWCRKCLLTPLVTYKFNY